MLFMLHYIKHCLKYRHGLAAQIWHCRAEAPPAGWKKLLFQSCLILLIALIPSRLIRQMLANFLELKSKGLYQSSGKEKESCCLVLPSSTKREIRHFHLVVVQRRQRNVQKNVMQVQSCCFVYIKLLIFCRSCSRRPCRCLSSVVNKWIPGQNSEKYPKTHSTYSEQRDETTNQAAT